MPWLIRNFTTEIARAVDNSQFDGNCAVTIGRRSVWPSTCRTQLISGGILPVISLSASATRAICARPAGSSSAAPEANRTSAWKTKRSPTMRMSERSPSTWRRRPKNSERKRASSSTRLASARLRRRPRSAICTCCSLLFVSLTSRVALRRASCCCSALSWRVSRSTRALASSLSLRSSVSAARPFSTSPPCSVSFASSSRRRMVSVSTLRRSASSSRSCASIFSLSAETTLNASSRSRPTRSPAASARRRACSPRRAPGSAGRAPWSRSAAPAESWLTVRRSSAVVRRSSASMSAISPICCDSRASACSRPEIRSFR